MLLHTLAIYHSYVSRTMVYLEDELTMKKVVSNTLLFDYLHMNAKMNVSVRSKWYNSILKRFPGIWNWIKTHALIWWIYQSILLTPTEICIYPVLQQLSGLVYVDKLFPLAKKKMLIMFKMQPDCHDQDFGRRDPTSASCERRSRCSRHSDALLETLGLEIRSIPDMNYHPRKWTNFYLGLVWYEHRVSRSFSRFAPYKTRRWIETPLNVLIWWYYFHGIRHQLHVRVFQYAPYWCIDIINTHNHSVCVCVCLSVCLYVRYLLLDRRSNIIHIYRSHASHIGSCRGRCFMTLGQRSRSPKGLEWLQLMKFDDCIWLKSLQPSVWH